MELRIHRSDRVALFGRTGTGKTTLAKHLLAAVPRVVVLDPKHTFTAPGYRIVKAFDRGLDRQIIRVPEPDDLDQWADAITAAWRRGRAVLYVDEATLVTPPVRILPALGKAIRTGRERGLGVWIASQRPKDIPSAVFTEAEHFFVFRLSYQDDRDKVVSFTGDAMAPLLERVRGHDFAYHGVDPERYIYVRNRLRRGEPDMKREGGAA